MIHDYNVESCLVCYGRTHANAHDVHTFLFGTINGSLVFRKLDTIYNIKNFLNFENIKLETF